MAHHLLPDVPQVLQKWHICQGKKSLAETHNAHRMDNPVVRSRCDCLDHQITMMMNEATDLLCEVNLLYLEFSLEGLHVVGYGDIRVIQQVRLERLVVEGALTTWGFDRLGCGITSVSADACKKLFVSDEGRRASTSLDES